MSDKANLPSELNRLIQSACNAYFDCGKLDLELDYEGQVVAYDAASKRADEAVAELTAFVMTKIAAKDAQ